MPIATSIQPIRNLDLNLTVGSMFIGVLFSALFYGLTCAQVVYYSSAYYNSDKTLVKAFVYGIMIFDTIITAVDAATSWAFVIEGHANPPSVLIEPKVYAAENVLVRFVICAVQMFYIHGLWTLLTRFGTTYKARLAITMPPICLSLMALVFGFVGEYKIATQDWIIQKALRADEVASAGNYCAAALADLCICVSLCWTLRGRLSGFEWSRTDNMIRVLASYIVNRGILLTAMQIVNLGVFLYSVKPASLLWFPFNCIEVKLYINSMMAVLNARRHLNGGGGVSYISGFTDDAATYVDGTSTKGAPVVENIPLTTFRI
ncbi:uncharacterized protein C8Q71DRAFT_146499 [Rhodofomes roseus]|uniref:DUF6534 domain-containing protein n=1 Tax=Rhodofomes roseus TaxID=34475 RepID=A0ABQ8KC30_9APHY|nr:uncharacterized protein C8Q71DRAFT_146499 [Rhodofomes roseus]KAH9834536.1 hypothetical protein C8Q71DRAFT_146499 [Rhodofomes roseus]